MKKITYFSWLVACFVILFSRSVLAGYCVVVNESDSAATNGSFRMKIEKTYNSGSDANCTLPGNSPEASLFQQGVIFNTDYLEASGHGVDKIILGSLSEKNKVIKFKNSSKNIIIGNWGPAVYADSQIELSAEDMVKYLDSWAKAIVKDDYGQVVIDAKTHFENGKIPFECANGTKEVYFRNVKLLTANVTRDMLPACIKNGGNFTVVPGGEELVCGDGFDNDNDGKKDCADSDCSALDECQNKPDAPGGDDDEETQKENCDLVGDEDGNGKADCSDDACKSLSKCSYFYDQDGDGYCRSDDKCLDGSKTGDCEDDPVVSHQTNAIHPGADESTMAHCEDFIDNDCDDLMDSEDSDCDATIVDADHDGYCKEGLTDSPDCKPEPDCNDSDSSIRPGAPQLCPNGVNSPDNDCNPSTVCEDNTITSEANCSDSVDNDNDGDTDCDDSDCASSTACEPSNIDDDGDGFSENNGDCNDADATIYTGNSEACGDNKDNNCSGAVDEGCSGDPKEDDDGDGFCEDADTCNATGVKPGDCDDTNAAINPEEVEVCDDNIDNDCDGLSVDSSGPGTLNALYKAQVGPACSTSPTPTGDKGSGGGGCSLNSQATTSIGLFGLMTLLLVPALVRKQKV